MTVKEAAAELTNSSQAFAVLHCLDVCVSQIRLVPSRGERSPVAVAKPAGLEDFDNFEVPCAQDLTAEILEWRGEQRNRSSNSAGTFKNGDPEELSSLRIRRK